MAKLRIQGDSTGYVDLEAPTNASSSTLNLDQVPQKNQNTTFNTGGTFSALEIASTQFTDLRLTETDTNNMWVLSNRGNGDMEVINNNNGLYTTSMRFDQGGRVYKPSQPVAIINNSSGNYGVGVIGGGSTQVNTGGMYNSSTGRFTVPISGTYLFTVNVYGVNSDLFEVALRKNGNYVNTFFQKNWTGGSFEGLSGATLQIASANDYFDFYNIKGQIRSSANEYRCVYFLG